MKTFDDVMGTFDFLDNLFGFIHQARSHSRGGRFGVLVKIMVPYGEGVPVATVRDHLKHHGVRLFHYGYNGDYSWFYVRKTQEKFARWLYDEETQKMRIPKSRWGGRK